MNVEMIALGAIPLAFVALRFYFANKHPVDPISLPAYLLVAAISVPLTGLGLVA